MGLRMRRCDWATNDLAIRYHDEEWGVPVHDDRKWFEFLILEGAQAGLSWDTILKKRETYRAAFDGFDPGLVAGYDAKKVESLLSDPGIIRNRLKVASAIKNAGAFLEVQREFGSFDAYIWRFVDGRPIANAPGSHAKLSPLGRSSRGTDRQQGLEAARVHVRRDDDLLRDDAGHRDGQRPPRRMFPPPNQVR